MKSMYPDYILDSTTFARHYITLWDMEDVPVGKYEMLKIIKMRYKSESNNTSIIFNLDYTT